MSRKRIKTESRVTAFQSTSSEEDVVSLDIVVMAQEIVCFNPRPPKRTLCREGLNTLQGEGLSFNPRPPKRTLCHEGSCCQLNKGYWFQSTSSEEDVVSSEFDGAFVFSSVVSIHVLRRGRCVAIVLNARSGLVMFQSTSSEEDVVSFPYQVGKDRQGSFNPRPPKRTLCHAKLWNCTRFEYVSIHVLRRGRCVCCS